MIFFPWPAANLFLCHLKVFHTPPFPPAETRDHTRLSCGFFRALLGRRRASNLPLSAPLALECPPRTMILKVAIIIWPDPFFRPRFAQKPTPNLKTKQPPKTRHKTPQKHKTKILIESKRFSSSSFSSILSPPPAPSHEENYGAPFCSAVDFACARDLEADSSSSAVSPVIAPPPPLPTQRSTVSTLSELIEDPSLQIDVLPFFEQKSFLSDGRTSFPPLHL